MRPKICKIVCFSPESVCFAPLTNKLVPKQEITLSLEELEAIRLKDLQDLEQKEGARKMKISQPTFHRVLKVARKKVADALANNKIIKIKGGNYKLMK